MNLMITSINSIIYYICVKVTDFFFNYRYVCGYVYRSANAQEITRGG